MAGHSQGARRQEDEGIRNHRGLEGAPAVEVATLVARTRQGSSRRAVVRANSTVREVCTLLR